MNSNLKRKATIYDLAQAAGISPSTISAILNGTWKQRRISEETAQRVQQLADARQYSVNRQARGLRKNRSGLIGMINGRFTGKKLADHFNATVTDWTGARKIINGSDRAADIADYAKSFAAAIEAAR